MQQSRYIKFIVITGYVILVALAVFGIVWINNELVDFSKTNKPLEPPKELVIISNTLTTMYQAEGTLGLLSMQKDSLLKQEYDSLMNVVFLQIDSLKNISINEEFASSVDSLGVLLHQKKKNKEELVQLMDHFENNTVKEITKEVVLSQRNLDELNDILLNNTIEVIEDTTIIVGERKGFFKRIRDAITDQPDTLKQISNRTHTNTGEIVLPVLTDTIIEFIKEVNLVTQRKNASVVSQIVKRQSELYAMNERTISQINEIMDRIESYEYLNRLMLMEEQKATLKRSSDGVALIAFAALVVAIFFMSWIIYSISVSQRMQREIVNAKKVVDDLLLSREQLLLTISHDIKAPISSIIGYLELMKNDKSSKKNNYYVENMQQSSGHILELVKNLLDFHSLHSEQQKMNPMPFYPKSLLTNIYESFIPSADAKELGFTLQIDIDSEEHYISDPYRIRQILSNILSNAIKFTPKSGSVTFCASIEVLDKKDTYLIMSVEDTGPGIKKEDRIRVFEEFRRLYHSGTEVEEGSGLGLNIAQKLSQLLGGTIEIDSTLGVGSIFTVKIPLHLFESYETGMLETSTSLNKVEVHENKEINKKIKILFIDDDIVQLNLLSELMKRENLNADTCSSAIEALQLVQKEQFDIIFSDIQMSDMNGFELVERIRSAAFSNSSSTPIIGLSANSHISEVKYKEAGFSGFLSKPFTSKQLFELIYYHVMIEQEPKEPEHLSPKEEEGFATLTQFAGSDTDAAKTIIHSFIDENKKNLDVLELAFQKEDWDTIAGTSHKMLPLMKMISAKELVALLLEYEAGSQSKENGELLLSHIRDVLKAAEEFYKKQ